MSASESGNDADSDDPFADNDVSFEDDFAEAVQSLSLRNQRKAIRQELTDPYNRLHSIALDCEFVQSVSRAYPEFALVANLRCGQWYVDPEGKTSVHQDVYFKSTDGHAGEWSFNLRRPNLGLIDVVRKYGGAVLVDSTRRGKSFPDALSKTVPIWCAVINRALTLRYPGKLSFDEDALDVHTASASVGQSERDQIRQRLQDWAEQLAASSYTLPLLDKPLRPIHQSPASTVPGTALPADHFPHCYPVVCCSASRLTSGGSSERYGSFNYVPGSGDDHESWAPEGMAAQIFWENKEAILEASRADLLPLLTGLVVDRSGGKASGLKEPIMWIGKTQLGICLGSPVQDKDTSILYLSATAGGRQDVLIVPLDGKRYLPFFTEHISDLVDRIVKQLSSGACQCIAIDPASEKPGKDIGIGLALCALVRCYDEEQQRLPAPQSRPTKPLIARRLEWIVASSNGKLNPSRNILKRVNDYLFSTYA